MFDQDPTMAWRAAYQRRKPSYEQLASEVVFALDAGVEQEAIKTHAVTSRVKSEESIAHHVKERELDDPLAQLDDVVGARVVVLFLSDLPRLDSLIRQTFEVHGSEDKVAEGDPSSFGYMSIHYKASFDDRHSGPRYDKLKGVPFEIQTRTVVMDAWANVSHYLDYKGETSVPRDLRKDFYALSGLFYVADQHFEMFADRSRESQEKAERELDLGPPDDIEINLDTLAVFLSQRYSDRRQADREAVSELVEEISALGYEHLGQLEKDLDIVESRFLQHEEVSPPHGAARFAAVGVVRVSLTFLHDDW